MAFSMSLTAFNSKTGCEVGQYAPDIRISPINNQHNQQKLSEKRGKYTLLNFWNTADANSRLATKQYQLALNDITVHGNIEMISINTDADTRLFEEIHRIDGHNSEKAYRYEGRSDKLIRKFGLGRSMKSFLIDPNGEIIAINPNPVDIAATIR